MNLLITGVAGFIGYHLTKKLANKKNYIFGIDNLSDYYDINLKNKRIKELKKIPNFKFYKIDLLETKKINKIVKDYKIKYIIHLAAQAGVRYSIENPKIFFKSNLEGFFNLLEISRKNNLKHLLFASSSSVYGDSLNLPTKENADTDKPLSFYAATKKSNEIMAYSYSNIYKLPLTSLRLFTVYGPFGRPDMALYTFISNIFKNKKNLVYNNGNHSRDFTYIEDVVDAITNLVLKPSKLKVPYQCFNIANGISIRLSEFIKLIRNNIETKTIFVKTEKKQGDVKNTWADINLLKQKINYKPKINIRDGVKNFVEWYKKYYNIK